MTRTHSPLFLRSYQATKGQRPPKSLTSTERASSGSALNVCSSPPMEVNDRESSFSIGMALPVWMEPEGNPGILMAQEGEILASMT